MKKAFLILPLAALVFLGAGCGGSSGAAPVVPAAVARCGNAYFPLQQGYSITYRNTFPGGAPTEYTMAVERVEGNEVDLRTTFQSGTNGTQSLECGPDGAVRAKSFISLGGTAGMTGQARTTAVRGELMPREIRVGTSWVSEFDVDVNLTNAVDDPLAPGRVTNTGATIKIEREALSEESVTVPAGTFNALKVRSNMTGLGGLGGITSYEWWVEDRGLVKVTTGDDQSIVSEAIRIQAP